jgi:cytochrome c5
MRRFLAVLAALGIVALALAAPAPASAQGAPGGAARTLPPGDGRDALATACSQCHALNVIMSMREGPAGWRRHVYNMVMRGAQLTPREADTVIAYLATNFGPGSLPAGAPTPTLPSGPGKDLVEARCTACHDLERVAVVKRQKADWPALVANMVGRGAVASPEEAQVITSYLVAHFGGE